MDDATGVVASITDLPFRRVHRHATDRSVMRSGPARMQHGFRQVEPDLRSLTPKPKGR